MRKELDFFKQKLNEQVAVEQFVYLLNLDSGGYRDGLYLDKAALSIEGLKQLLIEVQEDYFKVTVFPETIEIDLDDEKIQFAHTDYDGDKTYTTCTFKSIKIINPL